MEAYDDPLNQRDPLDLVESSGAILIPVPGLQAPPDGFQVGEVRFIAVPPLSWRLLEPNWIVDLYFDFYQAMPHFFCAWPFMAQDGDLPEDFNAIGRAAFTWMGDFLLGLRLIAPGILIDPDRLVFYIRAGGINRRPAEMVDRYRHIMYTTTFGDADVTVPAKIRTLGDRRRAYPERVIRSVGPGYQVTPELLPSIERSLALVRAYRTGTPNAGVEIALRNFTRSHDILLNQRQRLFCLLTAMEATFGGFERHGEGAGLGKRVAAVYALRRGDAAGIKQRVETELRQVRNALAHGAADRRPLDYSAAEAFGAEILRVGLPLLLRLALHARDYPAELAAVVGSQQAAAPSAALQSCLARAIAGDQQAQHFLTSL